METIPELKSVIADIRIARQKYKIKSSKLARESGISPSAMSKLETGKLKPSYELVYRVLCALETLVSQRGTAETVEKRMSGDVATVSPLDPISKARGMMKGKGFSQLPVLDANGGLVGMVTEGSILDNPEAAVCGDAAESNYAIVGPDTALERARQLARNVQAVLIVDGGKLVGILTKADFI